MLQWWHVNIAFLLAWNAMAIVACWISAWSIEWSGFGVIGIGVTILTLFCGGEEADVAVSHGEWASSSALWTWMCEDSFFNSSLYLFISDNCTVGAHWAVSSESLAKLFHGHCLALLCFFLYWWSCCKWKVVYSKRSCFLLLWELPAGEAVKSLLWSTISSSAAWLSELSSSILTSTSIGSTSSGSGLMLRVGRLRLLYREAMVVGTALVFRIWDMLCLICSSCEEQTTSQTGHLKDETGPFLNPDIPMNPPSRCLLMKNWLAKFNPCPPTIGLKENGCGIGVAGSAGSDLISCFTRDGLKLIAASETLRVGEESPPLRSIPSGTRLWLYFFKCNWK